MRVLRTQKWPLSDTIKFKITQIHFFRVTFFDVFSSVLPSSWLFMLLNVLMEDVLLSNSIGGSRGPPPLNFRANWGPNGQEKIFVKTASPPPPPTTPARSGSGTEQWLSGTYFGTIFTLNIVTSFRKSVSAKTKLRLPTVRDPFLFSVSCLVSGKNQRKVKPPSRGFTQQIGKSAWFKAPLNHETSF